MLSATVKRIGWDFSQANRHSSLSEEGETTTDDPQVPKRDARRNYMSLYEGSLSDGNFSLWSDIQDSTPQLPAIRAMHGIVSYHQVG